ncbi:MAG: MMPL family transporter [Burkholderiaceae bacterium]
MRPGAWRVLLVWLAVMLAGVAVVAQSRFTADMSFFLPRHPTPGQQVMVEQVREGSVARLLMLGIAGADGRQRADLSRALRQRLEAEGLFASVQNGQADSEDAVRELLLANRYLLSPSVSSGRFTTDGLRQAIDDSLALLASPAGMLLRPHLLEDPTGEVWSLIQGLHVGQQPDVMEGVWASRDGERALLLAQTRADGADTDGQQRAIESVRRTFDRLRQEMGVTDARLLLSGPGVFAVQARDTIRTEVTRLSMVGMGLIVLVLLAVYRSPRLLALGLLPVITGALAGIVAVSLVYGTVFAITVGFGLALIGESVDYAIYYFVQAGRIGAAAWQSRFWPTVRLGVLTSVAGFGTLLWAGFPGLAQLGLYALSGVLVAALVTRHVLPALAPEGLTVRDLSTPGRYLGQAIVGLRRWRLPVLVLAMLAVGWLVYQRGVLWEPNISVLSTSRAEDVQLDARLRADIGGADSRYLLVVKGSDRETVLQQVEALTPLLDGLTKQGLIGGYDSPARFLPSQRMQRERQAVLPDPDVLRERLAQAQAGSPLPAARLEPFVQSVTAARAQPLLRVDDLQGTGLDLLVGALLMQSTQGWRAVLPLYAPADAPEAGIDGERIAQALAGHQGLFIDLKHELDSLYDGYLGEAVGLSLAGLLAVLVLLAVTLRSLRRLLSVLLPLALAVALLMAGLLLAGERLHLLHLVGLLLVVAVGSNYGLFFDRSAVGDGLEHATLSAMAVANLTTVIGFGMLALSSVPVLHAIGVTVGPGAFLAFVLAAMFSPGEVVK